MSTNNTILMISETIIKIPNEKDNKQPVHSSRQFRTRVSRPTCLKKIANVPVPMPITPDSDIAGRSVLDDNDDVIVVDQSAINLPVVMKRRSSTYESLPPTPPFQVHSFFDTDAFRRTFVEYLLPWDAFQFINVSKDWKIVVERYLGWSGSRKGLVRIHRGQDEARCSESSDRRKEQLNQTSRVVFLCNTTKIIGANALLSAINLLTVQIPPPITSIGHSSFSGCSNLKTITFPKSLTFIGAWCFCECGSLEEVDLRGTGLRQIAGFAFSHCKVRKGGESREAA